MSTSIPKTMRAFTQDDDAKASVKEIAIPELEDNDVLVKVAYAAQNPTDWKHVAYLSQPGSIIGCDYSGTVVALGKNLKRELQVGDKVAGSVHGGLFKNKGAFAEFLKVESDLCFKVPGNLPMEDAASFGIPWFTAGHALNLSQGKPLPPAKVEGNPWYLIYGGSSAVGLCAIQLAKAMGYRVVAACGPHNFDLVKSYGADAVVDYHGADKASAEIKKITEGTISLGLDTISEGESTRISVEAFGDKGGTLNMILPPSEDAKKIRSDVNLVSTLMYTFLGKEFKFAPRHLVKDAKPIPAMPGDRAFYVDMLSKTPEIFKQFNIKTNPLDVRQGGLDDIQAGFDEMKAGKVSGKKLVYKVAA